MTKWSGNIISKDARYRTQTSSQNRGIYSLNEQLQHKNAGNWVVPVNIGIDTGYHFPDLTLITENDKWNKISELISDASIKKGFKK